MGVLPDWMVRELQAITPYAAEQKRKGVISFGETSYGYDVRCGYVFDIFTNVYGGVIDPKNFHTKMLARIDHSEYEWRSAAECGICSGENPAYVDIPPNSFALAETYETICVPRHCLALVIGKSTYARCGLVVNVTPLEPEWRGRVTMELSNTAQLPSRVYAGEGVAQVLFLETAGLTRGLLQQLTSVSQTRMLKDACCEKSYADKKGKYQDQAGLTNPKVD